MSYEPFDTDAQDQQAEDRRSEAEIALQNEIGDLKKLMSNPHGRRVVHRLLEQAHIFEAAPIHDAFQLAAWNGERNFGLRLMAKVTANCGEHYLAMLREHQK